MAVRWAGVRAACGNCVEIVSRLCAWNPGSTSRKPLEAADRQPRAGEQRQSRRNLRHHQRPAQPVMSRRQAASGFAQGGFDIGAHRAPGRRQSCGNRAQQHRRAGKCQSAEIQADCLRPHQAGRRGGDQEFQSGECDGQPQYSAGRRQAKALRKKLPQQAETRSSQRHANRNFLLACGGPCQQQVRDIRAGHQEHEPSRPQKQKHGDAEPPGGLRLQRLHIECEAAVCAGIFLRQCRRQGAHLVATPLRLDPALSRPTSFRKRRPLGDPAIGLADNGNQTSISSAVPASGSPS